MNGMMAGESAVRYARACVRAEVLGTAAPADPGLGEHRGVFVTLNEHPSGDLRGCIGYPYPVMSLGEAIDGAARAACHDPRFPDLSERELDGIVVEVTVLTVPIEIVGLPGDLRDGIAIGRDGLILEYLGRRGLLLPQVPVEWGWDTDEFLAHLSMKAGLPEDAWSREGARLWRFEGEVFSETVPGGDVVRRDFSGYREGRAGKGVHRR